MIGECGEKGCDNGVVRKGGCGENGGDLGG